MSFRVPPGLRGMSRLVFINLPVADLEASKAFFGKLGFEFDRKFTNHECACMVINDGASYAMLLQRERFAEFATKPIADASATTEALFCLSADSREAVDELADAALAAGGAAAKEPQDHGFMYGRSFQDPDGHHWEVMWMGPAAVEAGPEEYAAQQQSAAT